MKSVQHILLLALVANLAFMAVGFADRDCPTPPQSLVDLLIRQYHERADYIRENLTPERDSSTELIGGPLPPKPKRDLSQLLTQPTAPTEPKRDLSELLEYQRSHSDAIPSP